jgi:V8-like Glu-specific endopeptidase
MKLRVVALIFAIALGLTSTPSAEAIYKGTSALGSPYVVQVTTPNAWCSGTLVEPQILVTAAHCLVNSGVSVSASNIGVYPPGVDTSQSSIVARGYQIYYPSGYYNDSETIEPNDIAFVILDKVVNSPIRLKLANYESVLSLISQNVTLIDYGYGRINLSNRTAIPQQLIARPTTQKRYRSFRGYERTYIDFLADDKGSTCPGDSGGPVIAQFKGEAYLVAVHSGGRGPCGSPDDGDWGSVATIAGEYQYLLNDATSALNKLKPTDVSNVRISSSALIGNVTWDLPRNSPVVPTGYIVKDAASNELCRTTTNTCQVSLKPGLNLITVFVLAGSISSNGVTIEYVVKNATNPELIEINTHQTQFAVKWTSIRDFGGATPSATYVEIRDESDGSVLCTALATQNECRYSFLQKGYNLLLNVKSDLGQTESIQIGRVSGILQSSLVSRTISNLQNINTQLKSYLASNPGYKAEIAQLQSQLPVLTNDFIFTDEVLTQVLDTRNSVSDLVLRIFANPKKTTITCVKGKLTKKVTAINPKCSTGYKVKK